MSSSEDPLFPVRLPVTLALYFSCLRFSFCWPLAAFIVL